MGTWQFLLVQEALCGGNLVPTLGGKLLVHLINGVSGHRCAQRFREKEVPRCQMELIFLPTDFSLFEKYCHNSWKLNLPLGYTICNLVSIELAEKVTVLKMPENTAGAKCFLKKILLQYLIFAKLCTMYFNFILRNKFYCDSWNKTAAVYFLGFLAWPGLCIPVTVGPRVQGAREVTRVRCWVEGRSTGRRPPRAAAPVLAPPFVGCLPLWKWIFQTKFAWSWFQNII